MSKENDKFIEQEFLDIQNSIKNKNELSCYDFLRIRNFKLRNFSRENEENIKQITKESFKLAKEDKIIEAITELIKLHGVKIPIASAILAMKFPEKYAIIDINVIKSLGKETDWKDYKENPEIYREYILFMRKTCPKGKTLREYEFELFKRGREKRGGN